jgi:hypothetical protein
MEQVGSSVAVLQCARHRVVCPYNGVCVCVCVCVCIGINNFSVTGEITVDASHNKLLTNFRMMACNCEFMLISAVVNLSGKDICHLMQAYSHEIIPHGLITPQRIRGRSSESPGRDFNARPPEYETNMLSSPDYVR